MVSFRFSFVIIVKFDITEVQNLRIMIEKLFMPIKTLNKTSLERDK